MVRDSMPEDSLSPDISELLSIGLLKAGEAANRHLPIELEKWPLEIFLGSAIICFICSSIMHLLWVKSVHVCNLTHNVDLSGICLMIFGSAYGLIYYIFKCNLASYYAYLAVLVLSAVGILICINCKMFNKPKYQNLKVILFVTQACVALCAIIHWSWMKYKYIKFRPERYVLNFWQNVQFLILEMVCYFLGTFFFVSRFPESKFPGVFDLWVS